jgi:hypothetical protein
MGSYGYDSRRPGSNVTSCMQSDGHGAKVPVFGVEFVDGQLARERMGDIVSTGINITTIIKQTPGCQGEHS